MRAWLDRLFAPTWAGGWTWFRVLWAVGALRSWLPRGAGIEDAYASSDMVFSVGPVHLADHVVLTAPTAWALWTVVVGASLAVAWGGRLTKPAILVWLVAAWTLLFAEALNVKAHDRLQMWSALALLLGPTSETGLADRRRSPAGRWFLVLVYCALYGSTGWLKLLEEPGWRTGETLAYHLLHVQFAGSPLAVWASDQRWLVAPMGWGTVAFEALFPALVWLRRAHPWLLLVGVAMHLGISALMNVGPFLFVALAPYPLLLHPEVAERLAARLPRALGGTRDAASHPVEHL